MPCKKQRSLVSNNSLGFLKMSYSKEINFKSRSTYCSSYTVLFGRHNEKHVKMQFDSVAMDTSNLNEHLIGDGMA